VILATTRENILGGYTGYLNSVAAFFAIGAYTRVFYNAFKAPLAWASSRERWWRAWGAGLAISLALAACSSPSVAGALRRSLHRHRQLTSRRRARPMCCSPRTFPSGCRYIHLIYAVQLVMARLRSWSPPIEKSTLGRASAAIRDDELAAECSFVPP